MMGLTTVAFVLLRTVGIIVAFVLLAWVCWCIGAGMAEMDEYDE